MNIPEILAGVGESLAEEDLMRHFPVASTRSLTTRPLNGLGASVAVTGPFADDCSFTCLSEHVERLPNVRITAHGGKAQLQGVHIAVLSQRGRVEIAVGDDHTRVVVGADTVCHVAMQLFRRPVVLIGDRTTIGQARIIGAFADVLIGEDGLFSDEILVQSNDQHPLVDLDTQAVLNAHRRHIVLDRHVWVGRRAVLMPDIRIGSGAVIGAGALVTADVPADCVAAGVPARVVRARTSWRRQF